MKEKYAYSEIRPVIHHNQPVNTSIAFSLVQVVDVVRNLIHKIYDFFYQDERNQLLTSLAWVHYKWNDWRLAWDPQLNGRLTKMNVPVEVSLHFVKVKLKFFSQFGFRTSFYTTMPPRNTSKRWFVDRWNL